MKRSLHWIGVLGTLVCSDAFVTNHHPPFSMVSASPSAPVIESMTGGSSRTQQTSCHSHQASIRTSSRLEATSSRKQKRQSPEWNTKQGQQHLSPSQQADLLLHTTEHRRIKQVEKELRLGKQTRTITSLQLSRAAGYGDDLLAMEDAICHGELAREQLITSNMGLVYYSVSDVLKNKNKLQSVQFDDLVQEGAIGLSRAIDRWNPEIGGKFSTFAVYWIRAAILRNIAEQDDLIKVPEYVNGILSKIYKTSGWEEYESAKKLAQAAGVSDAQVKLALQVQQQRHRPALSFESWMQNGKSFDVPTAAEILPMHQEDLTNTLAQFLRPKEVEALSWRYGLYSQPTQQSEPEPLVKNSGKQGEAMSFKDVGKRMKISAEYGRKLCKTAIAKLQQAAEAGELEPALLSG